MVPDPGIARVAAHSAAFGAATVTSASLGAGHAVTLVATIDPEGLGQDLNALVIELDGLDWAAADPDLLQLCVDADLDFAELVALSPPQSQQQIDDRIRKQTGDLAELLAVLVLLSVDNAAPSSITAKNVLKLYETISEQGVDIVLAQLDLADDGLEDVPGERLYLLEVKGSSAGASFDTLAKAARDSIDKLDLHRFHRELRMLTATLEERQAAHVTIRLRRFILDFARRTGRVIHEAALVSERNAPPLTYQTDALSGVCLRVIIVAMPVDRLRELAFSHRP